MPNRKLDIAIVGGGVIGLSIGWQLARRGLNATILEKGTAGRGASWASAGMLGAQAEVGFEDLEVYDLGTRSMAMWPDFAAELEADSGVSVDYSDEGTLIVADDRDSAALLKRIYRFQREHGVAVEWISPQEAQELEPLLTPRLAAAVFSQADHQVDPRQVVRALVEAFARAGGELIEQTGVRKIELGGPNPILKTASGDAVEAETVILAAGAWSGSIVGLPEGSTPVRPVKGQMMELRMADPYQLRTVIRGVGTYLAPKKSGRLLVGATSEEMGFDIEVTAGGLYDLLERAWRIVPGIYEMVVTDSWAGLRPGTPDHAPIIGFSQDRRVVYATGHYRHGILHAPLTANVVCQGLDDGRMPEFMQVCDPRRFTYEEVARNA